MKITTNTIIQRNHEIIYNDMDGETVMMDIEQGTYYGLDSTATRIWELLDQALSVEQLCQQLCRKYAVSEADCLNETLTFLEEMAQHHVILTSEAS
ncbi:MAG: lasso peptide biosynthesis PqqD family chaperone [Methylococcales bacterium]